MREAPARKDGHVPPVPAAPPATDRPVRSFNRYEIEYPVPTSSLAELRLRRRVPVRLRRNWMPVGTCCAFVGVVGGLLGTAQVRPRVVSSAVSGSDEDAVTQDVAGKAESSDPDVDHTVELEFDTKLYQKMISPIPRRARRGTSPPT